MEDDAVRALRLELRATAPLRLTLTPPHAFHLAALLQLALRHPDATQNDIDLVKAFIDLFPPMGPRTAAIIEQGWVGLSGLRPEPQEKKT